MSLTFPLQSALAVRQWYRDKSFRATYAASQTTVSDAITCLTKWTLYIQKILFDVTTDAAQTCTFQDDALVPKVIAVISASPGVGLKEFDFGDEGIPLTEGQNLDIVFSGAGLAGSVIIEAYMKPTSTMVPSQT